MENMTKHGGNRKGAGRPSTSERLEYEQARAKLERIKADTAELDYEVKQGKLVLRDQVEKEYAMLMRTIRDTFLAMPGHLASIIAAETDVRTVELLMTKEVQGILTYIVSSERN